MIKTVEKVMTSGFWRAFRIYRRGESRHIYVKSKSYRRKLEYDDGTDFFLSFIKNIMPGQLRVNVEAVYIEIRQSKDKMTRVITYKEKSKFIFREHKNG